MNSIESYKNQIQQIAENSQISFNPNKTALLVIDVVNDGNSEEGFFKKVLKADISMFQGIENNVVELISACKQASIPTICVYSIFDFDYIPDSMRKRFEARKIKGLSTKGSWGAQIINKLLDTRPDFILIKSHYSPFSRLHSFMYKPNGNKIMRDYLTEANNVNIENINDYLKNGRVVALDTFLRARGIDTLIITGSATHVCEDAAVSAAS